MKSAGREAPVAEVISGLNDLLQLDHDAIGSYEIAIEKLRNRDHAARIEAFKKDHERHIRDLNAVILSLGGTPANEPHATAPLKQAIQQIAAAGGDETILAAWRTNELQVTAKYDGYAHQALWWPAEAKRVVDRNALDEERHYRWVAEVMGDGAAEVGLLNRAREEVERARGLGRKLRARADDMLGAAQSAASSASSGGGPGGALGVRAEELIRKSPAKMLTVAFGLGFVVGRILR